MFYPSMIGGGFSGSYALATATAAEGTAREARTDVELFKHDIDRLLMISEALWTLMKRDRGYTDDVLTRLIEEIDQRKVTVDGVTAKDPPLTSLRAEDPIRPSALSAYIVANPSWAIRLLVEVSRPSPR